MTDKEILRTIYRWLQQANSRDENPDHTRQRLRDFQSFIEQEWQKDDDPQQQSKALGEFSKTWYKEDYPNGPITDGDKKLKETLDVADTERHRGLEIGPDGTVKALK